MKRLVLSILAAFLFCYSGIVNAELYSVKLVSSAQPDCWSVEELVKEVTSGAVSDR